MNPLNLIHKLIFSCLLAATFFQPFISMQYFGPAGDEYAHLPAGYSYWRTGEIGLNPQHPPLIKLIAAFPLLFLNLNFSENDLTLGEWRFGRKFLFTNDADQILFWGRIGPILISTLLAWFVYLWSQNLFGRWAGIVALAMYTFMPNIISQAQFVATDLGVAAFAFITLYWLWRFFSSGQRRHNILTGIFLGLALGTKFSALVLIPIILFFLILKNWHLLMGKKNLLSLLAQVLAIAIPAFIILYIIYLFPSDPLFYWQGYQSLYQDRNPNFQFYLNGNFSSRGWWYYFPWTFLIKTPVVFLSLLTLAIIFVPKIKIGWRNLLFLGLPAVVFLAAAVLGAYNIGVRYILPVYPFLIVLTSSLVKLNDQLSSGKKYFITGITLLLLWQIVTTVRVFPHYLAYFNELIGGPVNGYKYLDDSNLSWGQEVKHLAEYQRKYPETRVIYKWYQTALNYYGVKNSLAEPTVENWSQPSPGKYAVDINYLIRAKYVSRKENRPEFDWLARFKPIDRIGYAFLVYEIK